jgi:hypothetical protein
MSETQATSRRKGERRKIPDRRSATDRRAVPERRHGQRRVAEVAVRKERRSGVDRRARVLATLSTHEHIVVHALRRLIGRLYQLAQTHSRAERAQTQLADARSEILKLDPNLYLVAKTLDSLKSGAIAKLDEFQHAQEMLAHFMPRPSEAKPTRRKSVSKNGARKSASSSKRTTKKTATKRKTKKTTTRKKVATRKTTS